ncbi:MAG: carboxypeptidase-like regulatory domain-containing protein, partial [Acidobacteriota bacterium]
MLPVTPGVAQELTVRGRALDEGGAPLAAGRAELRRVPGVYRGALVFLRRGVDLTAPIASVPLGADGRFELNAPAPDLYAVTVRSPGRVPMSHGLLPLIEPRVLNPVTLRRDVGLDVILLGPDGAAVEGARVRGASGPGTWSPSGPVHDAEELTWDPSPRFVRSDGRGGVRLPRAAGERLDIAVLAQGFLPAEGTGSAPLEIPLEPASGEPRDLRLVGPRGRPLAGAIVLSEVGPWPAAQANDGGTVHLPAGVGRIRVVTPDGRSQRFDLRGSDVAALSLRPQDRRTIRLVDDGSGNAVPGGFLWPAGLPRRRSLGDGAGLHTPWLPPGIAPGGITRWRAAAPGRRTTDLPWRFGDAAVTHLALAPAAAVQGRVTSPGGGPLADVAVRVRVPGWGTLRTLTWTDGGFYLGQLPSGRGLELELDRGDLRRATAALEPLGAFEVRRGLRVVMDASGVILGRLTDPEGRPIAGAEVVFEASSLEREGAEAGKVGGDEDAELETDREGRFASTVTASGLVDLRATALGFAPLELRGLGVDSGEPRQDLGALVMDPAALVRGRVTDPQGRALPGVDVFVFPRSFDRLDQILPYLRFRRAATATDAAGRFAVDGLATGTGVHLVLRRRGYGLAWIPGIEAPADGLTAILEGAVELAGTVVDPDSQPLAGADVRLLRPPGSSGAAPGGRQRTDADGRFRFPEVVAGPVEVRVESATYPAAVVAVEVGQGLQDEDLWIQLERGSEVVGRVLDSDGVPVSGASVRGVRLGG